MKMKALAIAAGLLMSVGSAQAALVDRGNGMIYDTTRNITWLKDFNYAKTSNYHNAPGLQLGDLNDYLTFNTNAVFSGGYMGWDAAKAWAAQLTFGGYTDWRLPTYDAQCASAQHTAVVQTNCTTGELTGLFVTDFGMSPNGLQFSTPTPTQSSNLQLFTQVEEWEYWTATGFNSTAAWAFSSLDNGDGAGQTVIGFSHSGLAVAVRDGDVLAPTSNVPEPNVLALAGLAFGAIGVLRIRRRITMTHR